MITISLDTPHLTQFIDFWRFLLSYSWWK